MPILSALLSLPKLFELLKVRRDGATSVLDHLVDAKSPSACGIMERPSNRSSLDAYTLLAWAGSRHKALHEGRCSLHCKVDVP